MGIAFHVSYAMKQRFVVDYLTARMTDATLLDLTPFSLCWTIGVAICYFVVSWFLESTKGTIVFGFALVIGAILYGIEAIKGEIRKRSGGDDR